MCGIIGYSGGNPVQFAEANNCQSHRGPDDVGLYFDRNNKIGLGHTRLSILDPTYQGHQPMTSEDEKVTLVFNGEIYNFREIRTELEAKGIRFHGLSDTEVLLNLYLVEGEESLLKLNGIFAFAIWNAETENLFIARDGLGVKPLYYHSSNKNFAFASEIKALIQLIPEERKLDYEAIHRYLTFLWCPDSGTPLDSVKKLLPGEAMVVRSGKIVKKWLWYQLPIFKNVSCELTESLAIEGSRNFLRQAVKRQMVSDVPVGAFLSGGLDSSAVVAFAREKNPDLHCFTIDSVGGQESGITDDLPYARQVAKHLGVQLDVVTVDSSKMASGLENMVAMLDEPLADPAPLNILYICQLARENGIKVLLSGAGGDDIFTGYRRHHAIQLDRWLQLIPSKLRSYVEKTSSSLNVTNPFFRRLAKLFNGLSLDGDERIVNYFRWADEKTICSLFTTEVRMELEGIDAAEPMYRFLDLLPEDVTPLERILALEQRFFLADHNLTYTDKMSMAAGVEVRVPYLDLDLVQFAAQIPVKYKQRGSVGKSVLKKAMEPYLPKEVIYRPKSGFGAPLRRWIRFELRELIGDILSEESLKKRKIFDPKSVRKLIKNNETGVVDASYTILSLMCIEIWCRLFIDGRFNYQKVYGSV